MDQGLKKIIININPRPFDRFVRKFAYIPSMRPYGTECQCEIDADLKRDIKNN